MPPNAPKIPDAEIELIRKWIEGGPSRPPAAWPRPRPSRSSSSSSTRRRWASRPARRPCPRTCSTEPFVPEARPSADRGDGRQPLGAAGGRRRAQAGAALPDDRPSPGGRPAVPRGDDPRPQVQPQRRPAAGRRRPRRPVGAGRRLQRQDRASASSRSARNTTPCSPPTSAPTTARSPSAARARSSASTTRPTAA